MAVTKISSFEQFKEIISGERPAVIDFFAPWCGPCKIISPVFHKFSEKQEFSEYVDFYEVDVDGQDEIAAEARIRAMPTFIGYAKGKTIGSSMGANSKSLLRLVGNVVKKAPTSKPESSEMEQQMVVA